MQPHEFREGEWYYSLESKVNSRPNIFKVCKIRKPAPFEYNYTVLFKDKDTTNDLYSWYPFHKELLAAAIPYPNIKIQEEIREILEGDS